VGTFYLVQIQFVRDLYCLLSEVVVYGIDYIVNLDFAYTSNISPKARNNKENTCLQKAFLDYQCFFSYGLEDFETL